MKKRGYHVVRIIDEFHIAVNIGAKDGITRGSILEIYEKGLNIVDPTNGESLGTIDSVMATVKVHTVYDKFSVCVNDERTPGLSALSSILIRSIGNLDIAGSPKELPIDLKDMQGGFDSDRTIRNGDLVRIVSIYTPRLNSPQGDQHNEGDYHKLESGETIPPEDELRQE